MQYSSAISKIQTVFLVIIILVAVVSGISAYFYLTDGSPSGGTIKIGVCADVDNTLGRTIWQGAVLAAEQMNDEGGVLGMDFEIVAEDDDSESASMDTTIATNALTRLITVDKADFIIAKGGFTDLIYQDIIAEHKKVYLLLYSTNDALTQQVIDDYDKYKYFFRSGIPNATSAIEGTAESIVTCREHTGFNKIGILYHDLPGIESDLISPVIDTLEENNFEVVYKSQVLLNDVDFSSYFAQAEAAGVEILYPLLVGSSGLPFVTEYYERQSPMVIWGFVPVASRNDFWEVSSGKCEFTSFNNYPVAVGYPLTNKTILTREAYFERWEEEITSEAAAAYDTVRFILFDAIRRAESIETEAVIEALENTDIETSLARRFIFTSSHDVFIGAAGPNRPTEDYYLVALFQWQDGKQVPVYPKEIMEEAGVTYTYPDWPGPWD